MQDPTHNPQTRQFNLHTYASPANILVATNFADTDFLVPYVIAQAKVSKARVTLVNAVVPMDGIPAEGVGPYIDLVRVERDARTTLLGIARSIEASGIQCDVVARRGNAADVIREQILVTGATRLIMATHGRGKLGQLTIGSVASDVLQNVHIPVFAVGPRAHDAQDHVLPQRILHPVSLDGDYERSVVFALEVAQAYRSELTLLHVLNQRPEKEINPDREVQWAKTALTSLLPKAADLQVTVHVDAVFGKTEEQICTMAGILRSDLIIMGTSGERSFWPFRETTAYKVLAAADCPVLTLPAMPQTVSAAHPYATNLAPARA